MSQADQALAIKEEAGKVKLVATSKAQASGKRRACIKRVPEEITIRLSSLKTLTIENLAANQTPIEVLMPVEALKFFAKHPLKAKPSQDAEAGEQHSVKLAPGKSAIFTLNGTPGDFKFKTDPGRCSGPHHDDVHIEC